MVTESKVEFQEPKTLTDLHQKLNVVDGTTKGTVRRLPISYRTRLVLKVESPGSNFGIVINYTDIWVLPNSVYRS